MVVKLQQVAISGVGEADHSKASGRSSVDIGAEAVARAIADAGLQPSTTSTASCTTTLAGPVRRGGLPPHFGTPTTCGSRASGAAPSTRAPHPPWPRAPCTAARRPHRERVLDRLGHRAPADDGGPGQAHVHDPAKRNLEMPFGWFPQPIYFAAMARRHMHDFGTTAEHLGAIAVACRRHANRTRRRSCATGRCRSTTTSPSPRWSIRCGSRTAASSPTAAAPT